MFAIIFVAVLVLFANEGKAPEAESICCVNSAGLLRDGLNWISRKNSVELIKLSSVIMPNSVEYIHLDLESYQNFKLMVSLIFYSRFHLPSHEVV